MNENTKKFFEKLAQGATDEEEEIKLVVADDEESSPADIFEEPEGQLAIDVYQTPTSIVVESAIAGVEADELDIEISPESVTIKGTREKNEKIKKDDYLYQECYWGRFARIVILPQEVDSDKANASIKNGILKVVLPKLNKAKTKKIKVKFD
ncbi:MAG: Hsp20/alpha crystallin family protein [Candidatus Wolfebacteria bacterium]|nr:Hsp20/alpha crystallin family protein [Candidatus Wolfebacteria bacterium]